jgi:hypothetical protein
MWSTQGLLRPALLLLLPPKAGLFRMLDRLLSKPPSAPRAAPDELGGVLAALPPSLSELWWASGAPVWSRAAEVLPSKAALRPPDLLADSPSAAALPLSPLPAASPAPLAGPVADPAPLSPAAHPPPEPPAAACPELLLAPGAALPAGRSGGPSRSLAAGFGREMGMTKGMPSASRACTAREVKHRR